MCDTLPQSDTDASPSLLSATPATRFYFLLHPSSHSYTYCAASWEQTSTQAPQTLSHPSHLATLSRASSSTLSTHEPTLTPGTSCSARPTHQNGHTHTHTPIHKTKNPNNYRLLQTNPTQKGREKRKKNIFLFFHSQRNNTAGLHLFNIAWRINKWMFWNEHRSESSNRHHFDSGLLVFCLSNNNVFKVSNSRAAAESNRNKAPINVFTLLFSQFVFNQTKELAS